MSDLKICIYKLDKCLKLREGKIGSSWDTNKSTGQVEKKVAGRGEEFKV
jgi:hypothetical protein